MCQQVVEPVVRHADVCQVQYRYTVVQFACSRKKQYMDIQSDVRRRAAERERGRERERERGEEKGGEERRVITNCSSSSGFCAVFFGLFSFFSVML